MEILFFALFALALVIGVAAGWPLFYALGFGYCLFFIYGVRQGRTPGEMLRASLRGIGDIRDIIAALTLIGVLSASWRASGTIAFFVYHASRLFTPSLVLVLCYLLCCAISFLTGSSFASAATMGAICMSIAGGMGIHPALTGGAVVSGIYFGDRCSPVSSSALLIAQLTRTNLFDNLKAMFRTSAVPVILTAGIYLLMGFGTQVKPAGTTAGDLFAEYYRLPLAVVIPVAIVLVLALFRVRIHFILALSVAAALLLSVLVQELSWTELPALAWRGFEARDADIGGLLNGGGILSMLESIGIVCLSMSFAGMFEESGFLRRIERFMSRLNRKMPPFAAMMLTSIITAAISCNQTLASVLTCQICSSGYEDRSRLALDLENTVIVIAGWFPWSIALTVPLNSMGAPLLSIVCAFYLFILPLYNLFVQIRKKSVRIRGAA